MNINNLISHRTYFIVLICLSVIAFSCGDDDGEGGGTPGIEPITISANVNEEIELENIVADVNAPDYIIDGFLQVNADLIINPGVCIEFTANSGLFINVDGSIQAVGTSSSPIKFTGVQKTSGFWRGIQVRANDVRNEMNHTVVEYAGSDPIATYASISINGGVAVEAVTGFAGSLKLNNSVIQQCDGYGLIVEGGTTLREFSSNTFIENTLAAVRTHVQSVGAFDATTSFVDNGLDGVEVQDSGSPLHDITQDLTWQPLEAGAVYRVDQSFEVDAQLTILPGTTIEFEANQTAIFRQNLDTPLGILVAKGTTADPITFTGVTKTAGYWRGLIIQSNSVLNEMDHCIVEYGGSDAVVGELVNIAVERDGLYAEPALKVTNSIIRHSAGCGIVVEAGDFTESGNTFTDNVGLDICS